MVTVAADVIWKSKIKESLLGLNFKTFKKIKEGREVEFSEA